MFPPYIVRILLLAIIFITFRNTTKFIVPKKESYRYAIIFDAGSTATRIHIYRFRIRPTFVWKLDLVDEYFEEVQPGISSLKTEQESQEQTEDLLESAFKHFPQVRWDNRVPYVYRATAGLRAMPDKQNATKLLLGAWRAIKRYTTSYQYVSVSVLNGHDEGIYSWITMAYLLKWSAQALQMTTMDMGGLSTQITWNDKNSQTRFNFPSIGPKEYVALSSESLSNFGLISVRHRLLNPNCSCSCMKQTWMPVKLYYQGDHLTVYGSNEDDNEQVCRQQIYRLIEESNHLNITAHLGKVYLFSYFFDVAMRAGMINCNKGASLKVVEFSRQAVKWCSSDQASDQFLCLDLAYVYAVLSKVLKLPDEYSIEIVKKIRGIEVSWTLGLILTVM